MVDIERMWQFGRDRRYCDYSIGGELMVVSQRVYWVRTDALFEEEEKKDGEEKEVLVESMEFLWELWPT